MAITEKRMFFLSWYTALTADVESTSFSTEQLSPIKRNLISIQDRFSKKQIIKSVFVSKSYTLILKIEIDSSLGKQNKMPHLSPKDLNVGRIGEFLSRANCVFNSRQSRHEMQLPQFSTFALPWPKLHFESLLNPWSPKPPPPNKKSYPKVTAQHIHINRDPLQQK